MTEVHNRSVYCVIGFTSESDRPVGNIFLFFGLKSEDQKQKSEAVLLILRAVYE